MAKKIFIIEDDANILFSLQAKFSVAGLEVITHQGNESEEIILERVKAHSPDYLVLDLILPRAHGFNIISQLKSSRGLSSLPVFVFTNLSDSESREKALATGANYYSLKSELNNDEFVEKVRKTIINFERK